ncbi:MAG: ImmA/IrrE family metallo-endopeptidase [Candidatus Magasanikbacteria bacterium]|nr:ImmA/IrrE family metallo-endopeptidase [Candidatus Magasanikbacteria bacterium]
MNFSDIAKKAEEIAEKYNPKALTPFPFERIEQDRPDLSIVETKLDDGISGAIRYEKDENKFRIFVDSNIPENRKYFTIAHELGHYFLHQDIVRRDEVIIDAEGSASGNGILYRLDEHGYSRIETEANKFASVLLMPQELVIDAREIVKDIEELAKIFKVSVSAMSIRLEELSLV